MGGLAKASAALADIIATSSLCYILGYARAGVKIRACVTYVFFWLVLVFILDRAFQHGLGPQVPDWIRDPARCFGVSVPDCVFDRILCVLFALVLVWKTPNVHRIAVPMTMSTNQARVSCQCDQGVRKHIL